MKQLEFNEWEWSNLIEALDEFIKLVKRSVDPALIQRVALGGPVTIERTNDDGITRICLHDGKDEEDEPKDSKVIPRERVDRLLERVREQAQLWKEHQHKAYSPGQSLPIPEVWKALEYMLEAVLDENCEEWHVYWCPHCHVVHRRGICPVCSLGFPEDPEPVNEQEQEYASQNA